MGQAVRQKTVSRVAAPPRVQRQALRVSSPKDPAEKEAEATAKKVARFVSPYAARFAGAVQLARSARQVSRKAEGQPDTGSNVAAELTSSLASGSPLPLGVRRFMEPRFRADFSGVRIHTGERAARLNRQFSAQAFTYGNQIFFGRDRFKPETDEGRELIAHELTHTIQQGAAVQRSEDATVTQQTTPHVQRLGLSDALDYFADKANLIPGFRMFTIVLGVNPINMSRVERSAANILRAVVEFIPGGGLIVQALDNYGVFDRAGRWIEQQLAALGITGASIRQAIDRFLDSLSWRDIFDLGGVWNRAVRILSDPIDRILRLLRSVGGEIIRMIKDAILMPLAQLASRTRGWDLLCAVLGRNPITGDPVPRNAETLIGGFMRLIGQEEIWQNIQRSGAVARAWAWFQGALSGLMGFVSRIPALFMQALRELEIADIVLLPRAFLRVGRVFGSFALQFFSWAGGTIWNLLEIIFSVVAPGVMVYLQRARAAFRSILRNPVGFIGNLVRAGILGLRQFATNFLRHLRASLIGWLTGAMSGANIYIPQAFNLREIVKFILSVLGLTWQNIRAKLVRAIGETAVAALETTFDIVRTLVTEGPAAAWEKIVEQLTNLREMVMEQIMTFVRDRVVQAAITRLVTSLNPAGAFIQAILAIYNTVMFFVERMRQIAQVAASVIDSLAAIAAGTIGPAANRVEQTMAGLLTLVISFLARIAGLGRVSDAVTNVINRVRQPIDRALDRIVDWIVAQARRLGRLVVQGARAAVAAVTQWWRRRSQFTDEQNRSHALYFAGEGRAARLTVASAPEAVEAFLNRVATAAEADAARRPFLRAARYEVQQLTPLLAEIGGITTETPRKLELERSINQRVEALARAMRPLMALAEGGTTYAGLQDPLRLNNIRVVPFEVAPQRDPNFPDYERVSEAEFRRQLTMQQETINGMKVDRWLSNVNMFATSGARSTEGSRMQEEENIAARDAFRDRITADRTAAYQHAPYNRSADDARIAADRFVAHLMERAPRPQRPGVATRTTFVRPYATDPITGEQIRNEVYRTTALHSLDQVAGGSGTDLAGQGGASEDYSIGIQWVRPPRSNPSAGRRVDQIRNAVNEQVTRLQIRRGDLSVLSMNVTLELRVVPAGRR